MSWQKQSKDKPLFEDLLWSRPENKQFAGKLLIIGGNLHSFNAPSQAFQITNNEGAGSIRVILPVSLKKTVGNLLTECDFGPINPSGSFSKSSLDIFVENAAWSDAVLLAGDFGKNSETAVLIESFLNKFSGLIIITKDCVDYIISSPHSVSIRQKTTLVLTLSQLQKLAKSLKSLVAFRYDVSAPEFADNLSTFTKDFPFILVVNHLSQIWVSNQGIVSSTKNGGNEDIWRVPVASKIAVWQMQNPSRLFEAATSALI